MSSFQGMLFYWMLRLSKPRNPLLRGNLTIQQQRDYLAAQSSRFNKVPDGVGMEPVKIGTLAAEWLRPRNAPADRAVVYLHGGAFTMGSSASSRGFAALIGLACGLPVLSLDYRLAPEFPFPAGVEDVLCANRWLIEGGLAPKKIAIVGESGGGTLALQALMRLPESESPGAVVALSPLLDLGSSMQTRRRQDPLLTPEWVKSHVNQYLGGCDPRAPEVSPLFASFPPKTPILIQVGEHEILYEDALRFGQHVQSATVTVGRGMWHGWQKFAPVPESKQAMRELAEFVQRGLSVI